ncbi:MAG: AI-2E family transporter [Actinomycetota bacterium]|nr:AI-2E family transporter [Actinomycetota bacterium]
MQKLRKKIKNGFFNNSRLSSLKNIGIFSWSLIGFIIIILLIFYVIYLVRTAITPLLIGIIIAYMLIPLVKLLQKKMRKIFAVTISYVIFIAIIFILMFFLIPLVIEQFKTFIMQLPYYMQSFSDFLSNLVATNTLIQNIQDFFQIESTQLTVEEISKYLLGMLNIENFNIFQGATTVTRTVFSVILNFIIGPILGFYILKDTEIIRSAFLKIIPVRKRLEVDTILTKVNRVFSRYIRGQLIISFIVGALCTIALLILRIDFAVLLGFMAGLFNLIPFLGPIIGAIPAAFTALIVSPLKALLVVIIFVAIQQIDNYVISPNIMKYQIGLHPGIIIFSLIAGGAVFGWIGLLLAVPVVAIIQEILRYYLVEKKRPTSR